MLEGEEGENSETQEGSSHTNQLKFGDQQFRGFLGDPDSELCSLE